MTDAENIRLIEQDRKRREREWWLLLLFLFDEGGIDDVASHIRHDGDVGRVLNNVLGKAVVPLSRVSAAAHIGGMRRFARLTDQTFAPPDAATTAEIARQYEASARLAVESIIATLKQAVADVREKFPDEAASYLARSAFDNAGMSSADKSALRLGAERAIVSASNAGMFIASWQGGATGLAHHSVLDDVTTDLCRERDGLKLPIDSTFWLSSCPPLHWNCRSVLLPIIGHFLPSVDLPTLRPAPGFGLMPLGFLQQFGIAA